MSARLMCIGIVAALFAATNVSRSATVNSCDETSLRAALASGGHISFNCDGVIVLSGTLVISQSVVLDATGRNVAISGNDQVRVFEVGYGLTLQLINLTIQQGLEQGTNGARGGTGGNARGGAISFVTYGGLIATDCRFINNRAVGGRGGDVDAVLVLGPGTGGFAEGGAIAGGQPLSSVFLTNCVFLGNAALGGAGGGGTIFGRPVFGAPGGSKGGALSLPGAMLITRNCAFTNNTAVTGGAIAFELGQASVSNCSFVANTATDKGGAIYHLSGLTVSNSRFIANSTGGRPAQGGAVFSSGDLTVARSEFTGNSALGSDGVVILSQVLYGGNADGGALCILSGIGNITDSTFDGNSARGGSGCCPSPPGPAAPGSARGGAIYSESQSTIQNATFVHNAASAGGGIAWGGHSGVGGAVACGGGELRIQYSTIASNGVSAPNAPIGGSLPNIARGGGLAQCGGLSHLIGSILSGNTTNELFGENVFPSSVNGGSNLSSDNTGGNAANSFLNVDPMLAALADNGGSVQTMELLAGSPAIDSASSVGPYGCPATDARGMPRGTSGKCDIGAFEQTSMAIWRQAETNAYIRYFGLPNKVYALEVSSDLVAWQRVTTQASGIFMSISADAVPGKFFRARLFP